MLTRIEIQWPPTIPRKWRHQIFTGQVIKSFYNDPAGTIRLRTGQAYIPEILLPKRHISSRNDTDAEPEVDSATTEVFQVPSSKGRGQHYTVTFSDGRWTCTCTGFGYKASCRHIRIAAGEDLVSIGAGTGVPFPEPRLRGGPRSSISSPTKSISSPISRPSSKSKITEELDRMIKSK